MSRPDPPAVDQRPRVSRTLVVALVLLTLVGVAGAYLSATQDESAPSSAPDGGFRGSTLPVQLTQSAAPPIRLRDSDGRLLDTRELGGRPYAVTFLYTQCPDVCPLIGQQVKQGLEQLGAAGRDVTVLIVSVDPRGDTAEAVRVWMRRQRMPSNVRYLIGSRDELRPVWEAYYAVPQDVERPETSTHSAAVWLIDADGRRRTKLDAGQGLRPEDFAHDMRLIRREPGAAP
jgi:protein SCO1/2